jgi:hypothetical protein
VKTVEPSDLVKELRVEAYNVCADKIELNDINNNTYLISDVGVIWHIANRKPF